MLRVVSVAMIVALGLFVQDSFTMLNSCLNGGVCEAPQMPTDALAAQFTDPDAAGTEMLSAMQAIDPEAGVHGAMRELMIANLPEAIVDESRGNGFRTLPPLPEL